MEGHGGWFRGTLAVLALVALLAIPHGGATLAQSTTEPAQASSREGTAVLIESLLTATDLPAGFEGTGPQEGSEFDIDASAFEAHGGVSVVSQVWTSQTSGVVFDLRLLLPTDEAAASYLSDAEATLSEQAASGLSPVLEMDAVGEDGRHFAGIVPIEEQRSVVFDDFLFQVRPVAAKVFVAGLDLPVGQARALAVAAAARHGAD